MLRNNERLSFQDDESRPVENASLQAIWIKRAHRGPMDPVAEAQLEEGRGLVGNVDRSRRRQVTIIDRHTWDRLMTELDADADPSGRRCLRTGPDGRHHSHRR